MGLSSCQDDLLTGTPSWLGSSIYEELESRGQFTQTLALINDPDLSETNYPDLLRRTGSMTLFVADDAAWQRFLSKRGLTSVTQLPKAEKKNLLKSAMINNAYLIELLSNTAGDPPTEGACLRRTSRMDIADSIPVVVNADFPIVNPVRTESDGMQIDYWAEVRDRKSIKLYKDNTASPMVHFLPEYMKQNSITDLDLDMLTNGHYPQMLKDRVMGDKGHLDNAVASRFVADNYHDGLQYVFLCHLSKDNNTEELALTSMRQSLEQRGISVGDGSYDISQRDRDVQIYALPRYISSSWFVLA